MIKKKFGWTKFSRNNSDLKRVPSACQLFIFLNEISSYRDEAILFNGKNHNIKRGQCIVNRSDACEQTGLSFRGYRTAISSLINLGIITVEYKNKYSIISIVSLLEKQVRDTQNDTHKTALGDTHKTALGDTHKNTDFEPNYNENKQQSDTHKSGNGDTHKTAPGDTQSDTQDTYIVPARKKEFNNQEKNLQKIKTEAVPARSSFENIYSEIGEKYKTEIDEYTEFHHRHVRPVRSLSGFKNSLAKKLYDHPDDVYSTVQSWADAKTDWDNRQVRLSDNDAILQGVIRQQEDEQLERDKLSADEFNDLQVSRCNEGRRKLVGRHEKTESSENFWAGTLDDVLNAQKKTQKPESPQSLNGVTAEKIKQKVHGVTWAKFQHGDKYIEVGVPSNKRTIQWSLIDNQGVVATETTISEGGESTTTTVLRPIKYTEVRTVWKIGAGVK